MRFRMPSKLWRGLLATSCLCAVMLRPEYGHGMRYGGGPPPTALEQALDEYAHGDFSAAAKFTGSIGSDTGFQRFFDEFRRVAPAWARSGDEQEGRRLLAAATFVLEGARIVRVPRPAWLPQRELIKWTGEWLEASTRPLDVTPVWFLAAIGLLERAGDAATVFDEAVGRGAVPDDDRSRHPENYYNFLARALKRFPQDPKLRLETAAPLLSTSALFRPLSAKYSLTDNDQRAQTRALAILQPLETSPSVEAEVLLDEGAIALSRGTPNTAINSLSASIELSRDRRVSYLAYLLRGHCRALISQEDEAASSDYQAAALLLPHAWSAKMALVGLLFGKGSREHANTIMDSVMSEASDETSDPFVVGRDFQYPTQMFNVPGYLAELRQLIR